MLEKWFCVCVCVCVCVFGQLHRVGCISEWSFVPDALKNLVGEDNARRGTIKVFEVLQNKTLNKHLIYVSVWVHVLPIKFPWLFSIFTMYDCMVWPCRGFWAADYQCSFSQSKCLKLLLYYTWKTGSMTTRYASQAKTQQQNKQLIDSEQNLPIN